MLAIVSISTITNILQLADPIGIAHISDAEYDIEAVEISSTIKTTDTADQILSVVFDTFCNSFTSYVAGEREAYREISINIFSVISTLPAPVSSCEVCNRRLGDIRVEYHHLIPRELGGRVTIPIHRICHQKIHATFTNRELLHQYNTVDAILTHPEIQKFVKWVQNKDPSYYTKNDDTSGRKAKR